MKTFKEYSRDLLTEVFVIGNKKANEGDHVVAYNKWVWVFDDEDFDKYKDDIMKKIRTKEKFEIPDDIRDYVDENNTDIIYGTVERDKYLNIVGKSDFRQSVLSTDLHKVLKALKLKGIETSYTSFSGEVDGEFREAVWEFGKSIKSQTFYHGTSYNYINNMLKTGIRATGKTNYNDIVHENKVFITVKQDKAYYHAENSANENNSFPLIISLKIPDPDKLVLDYDVAISLYGKTHPETVRLGFSDINEYATRGVDRSEGVAEIMKRRHKDKNDLNTKLGVFGYSGRIPAKFFKGIVFDEEAFKRFYLNEVNYDHGDGIEWGSLNDWVDESVDYFEGTMEEVETEIEDERREMEEEEDY